MTLLNKTFITISKNKKILLTFLLPTLAIVCFLISFFAYIMADDDMDYSDSNDGFLTAADDYTEKYIQEYQNQFSDNGTTSSQNKTDIFGNLVWYSIAAFLLIQIFYMPPFYNLIYESAKGEVQPKWYSRGLRENGLSLFLFNAVYWGFIMLLIFIVGLIIVVLSNGFFLWFNLIVYLLLLGLLTVFGIYLSVPITAKTVFFRGLKIALTIAKNNFFKYLLLGIAFVVGFSILVVVTVMLGVLNVWVSVFFGIGVLALFIYALTFLYTYSMIKYIQSDEEASNVPASA